MYPELLIVPMREELTKAGVKELRTAEDVDAALAEKAGTALVIVNSVCGCAAGVARPGVANVLPSSPSLALYRNGELVHFVPRSEIESRTAEDIAQRLSAAFEQYCEKPVAASN